MLPKLLTNCDEDALLVNCAEGSLLRKCTPAPMTIVYSWTGGYDLITETIWLGNALGWYANGTVWGGYWFWTGAAWEWRRYMRWQDVSSSKHEDYTIRVDDANAHGLWATMTTIYLEADWFFSTGTVATVTVTYKGSTQSKTITPGFISGVTARPASTSVGYIEVNDNGTWTLF